MKIAIASQGKELSSNVDPRFGRASYILIFDTNTRQMEVLDNRESSEAVGGAGVKTAETIVEKNAECIVSQNFGPKALQVFKSADVKAAVISSGTIEEAIEKIKNGMFHSV